MDLGGWVVLAVLWALLNLLTKGKEKRPPRARPLPQPRTPDASQQEGSRLEAMLRDLQRTLEESAGVEQPTTLTYPRAERPARTATLPPLEEEEDVEERESLETEPEVISLETEARRAPRPRIVQDEGAEAIEARRISAAAGRDRAATKADHAAFDKRIRQEPAEKTATRYTARQLRDAMVWREILGKPVSER